MLFIGITGGVGAGKSAILSYLSGLPGTKVLYADEIARELMEPGGECYPALREALRGEDAFLPGGGIDREKMAGILFSSEKLRGEVDAIVHPRVRRHIERLAARERSSGATRILVLEAALLVEENYGEICDELWYIYASEDVRRRRLAEGRGYGGERIRRMFQSQLSEGEYRAGCDRVIDNDGPLGAAIAQVDAALREMEGGNAALDGVNAALGGIAYGSGEPDIGAAALEDAALREMEGVNAALEGVNAALEGGIDVPPAAIGAGESVVGGSQMSDRSIYEQPLVFGLDIGTRNVVGTVGYRDEDGRFIVVAQHVVEHETRAMLDGQIHDIGRVATTIARVKAALEEQLAQELTEVCIAAAGRVLKTVTTTIEFEYPEETVVSGEDIHTLDLLGIEKAQSLLKEDNDTRYKFYCVGYSTVKYFLNDEPFSNLESHKAERISEEIIVTFLPEDVVDGLYAAVGMAGLSVANLTLEPIAAINVAIPENFRLLNIALVDIGAGTSDICVTRDGSIIAYGMIPLAGDEITELIVQHYLVDFKTAEHIKLSSGRSDKITYKDILMIEHTISAKEVWTLTEPVVDRMTTEVAAKIKELNGGQSVAATFVVGGGGKIHGYTEMLAEKLGIPSERVALRGEEVLQEVTFLQEEIQKDPLLVTPIGICLNYYDQRNSFIMVRFNGERIKLYDNSHLTIVDAALQAGFPNEDIFPKRGQELEFTVDGAARIVRGEPGESAAVYMNGRLVNINARLEPNCEIEVQPSTAGAAASCTLEQLQDGAASMRFVVCGRIVRCPKFLEVNGSLEMPSYQIREGDQVETRSFYTVGQLAEFMDVELDMDHQIMVNNRVATLETLIYENFTIDWTVLSFGAAAVPLEELEVAPPEAVGAPGLIWRRDGAEEAGAEPDGEAAGADDIGGKVGQLAVDAGQPESDVQQPSEEQPEVDAGQPESDVPLQLGEEQLAVEGQPMLQPVGEAGQPESDVSPKLGEEQPEVDAGRLESEVPPQLGEEQLTVKADQPAAEEQTAVDAGQPMGDARLGRVAGEGQSLRQPEREAPVTTIPGQAGRADNAGNPALDAAYPSEMPASVSTAEVANPAAAETAPSAREGVSQMQSAEPPVRDDASPAPKTATFEERVSAAFQEIGAATESPAPTAATEATSIDAPTTPTFASRAVSSAAATEPIAPAAPADAPLAAPMASAAATATTPIASAAATATTPAATATSAPADGSIVVYVNQEPVRLTGKKAYIFVDIFNFYAFDLRAAAGRAVVTRHNGEEAHYTSPLADGDRIELRWEERGA